MNTEAVARRCFVKKVFLNISQSSQENTCVRVPFVIKLQAWSLKSTSSLKERLWYRCFPVNLRTPFLTEHLRWLLLWTVVTVAYLVYYDTLLQNVTDITKRDNYFITKFNKRFSQNAWGFLFYYKMQQLLQNASVHNSLWTNDTDYIFNTNVTELLRIYALSCFSYFRGDRSR